MWIGVVPWGPPDNEIDPVPGPPDDFPGIVGRSVVARGGRDFLVGERGPAELSALAELVLFLAFTFLGTPEMEAKLS